MQNDIYKNYLQHHGILGQKWGKRNGPPYPLGESEHSAREKKMGWRKSLDKTSPAKHTKNSNLGKTSESDSNRKSIIREQGKIGGIDEAILSTAISTIPVVTILVGKKFVDDMCKRKLERKFAKNVTGPEDLPRKQSSGTIEDDMRVINPKFNKEKNVGDYQNNCMYCSAVYDLRRRGFDVTANARKAGGNSKEVASWYKNVKIEHYRSSSSLQKALQQQEDGARGYLDGFNSLYNAGHAIAYERRNGKTILIDAQSNKIWDFEEYTTRFNTNYHVVRLDDHEPDWSKIGEIINPEDLRKE